MHLMTRYSSVRRKRAFTLTEMLVAISVLLVVVLATSSIFGTAQKVASVGESNSELLQQAIAIERVMRRDFDRLSRNGFFAIQCVAVRNDINKSSTGRLLDPTRPDDAEIRADQLLFFANGAVNSRRLSQSYAASGQQIGVDVAAPAQAYFSSIFYSPGLQVTSVPPQAKTAPLDLDREAMGEDLFPWTYLPPESLSFQNFDRNPVTTTPVPLFPATADDWVLARQEVLLADDDGARNVGNEPQPTCEYYMGYDRDNPIRNSACSLFVETDDGSLRFDPDLLNSRLDVAATDETQLKSLVCYPWNSNIFGGSSQVSAGLSDRVRKEDVLDAMYYGYPRAEFDAPAMNSLDIMLTDMVLAPFVSDFRIEWTWEDGVGRDLDTTMRPDSWQIGDTIPSAWNEELFGGFPGVVIDGSWISAGRNPYGSPSGWNEYGTLRSSTTPWFGLSSIEFETAPAIAFAGNDRSLGDLSDTPFGLAQQGNEWDDQDVVNQIDLANRVRIGPPVGPELGRSGSNPFSLTSQNDSGNLLALGDDTVGDPLVGSTGHSPLTLIEAVGVDGGSASDGTPMVRRYGAVFGYNYAKGGVLRKLNGEPYTYGDGVPIFGDEQFQVTPGDADQTGRTFTTYTPWPSAVRISLRLHDSKDRIAGARDVQFVIKIPKKNF